MKINNQIDKPSRKEQTVVVVEPGESVFEVVQCVSRFSRCFR